MLYYLESIWGACSYESLACGIVLVFLEVLDEAFCEVFSLDGPFFGVSVGVAGIEDLGIYAGEFGRNLEIEDGEFLCGSLEDSTVEDSVDDTAGITDRDTFAGTVRPVLTR